MTATTTTLPLVSVEEYLRSSYHPNVDYVHGDLLGRNIREIEHSDLQGELIARLRIQEKPEVSAHFPKSVYGFLSTISECQISS